MTRKIQIIGVPMDLGQSRRGVDMGPSALRYAGLDARLRRLDFEVDDQGNIEIPVRDTLPPGDKTAYLSAVAQACGSIYLAGQKAIEENTLPIFIGGDHSIAIGTIGGVTHQEPSGVLWIDAHGDLNTPETSPSGNLHGMPLAALLGFGDPELVHVGRLGPKVEPPQIILIGIRDLDPGERELIRKSRIRAYTMSEIDEKGIAQVAQEALAQLRHLPRLHISLDMDSLDPKAAPGVGTPVPGGLTYREAHLLMELLAAKAPIGSVDVVEINPILDHQNETGKIAVELIASLLGQTIL